MTQETFIKKVKNIYGDKFDFSKVVYNGCKSNITVICPIHGEFIISAQYFLQGHGCLKCNHFDNFIKKAKEVHGNKYDYSKVEYKHCNTPICIICPEHGEFWQKPSLHLVGCECPKCGKNKSIKGNLLTQEEFIKKAKEVHNNKYDYSKSEYINWNTPICIICPIHGEFWQKPAQHLRGNGCFNCYQENLKNKRNSSANEFKKYMLNKFGDVIDFSEMYYKNTKTPITLICKKDGNKITKTPTSFKTSKIFCTFCFKQKTINNKPKIDKKQIFKEKLENKYPNRFELYDDIYINQKTKINVFDKKTKQILYITPNDLLYKKIPSDKIENNYNNFIKKANEIHNNKYTYSKVEYINSKTKVCIICPEHGEFYQTPNDHLKGCECPKCAGNIKWKYDDFIREVTKIHNGKYDYSKTILTKICDNITVICPIHGEFQIRGHVHLNGGGCRKCKGSGGEQVVLKKLEEEKIDFEYNCFYKWVNNLQFDFYIPKYKIAIEIQGIQHFCETNFFKTSLEEQIRRDEEKRLLCEENGVKLFYYAPYKYNFPYTVFTDINELWIKIKEYIQNI